jgi:hypothetical protein
MYSLINNCVALLLHVFLELSFTDHLFALGHGDEVKVGVHNLINNCAALLLHVFFELSFTDHSFALSHGDDVKVGVHNLINNCVALLLHVFLELSFTDHSFALGHGDEVKVGVHNLIKNFFIALLLHVFLEKEEASFGWSIVRVVGKNQLSFTDHLFTLVHGDDVKVGVHNLINNCVARFLGEGCDIL